MLSRNLEQSLHRALSHASERNHEYATLEHLLLALTEDQDAVAEGREGLRHALASMAANPETLRFLEVAGWTTAILRRLDPDPSSGR